VTVIDEPRAAGGLADEPAQVLFLEARQRRRTRWVISGVVSGVLAVVLAVLLTVTSIGGGGHSTVSSGRPPLVPSTGHPTVKLSFRPVLCYAPTPTLAAGQTASTGPLPSCGPAYQLTAGNLAIRPDLRKNANGYTGSNIFPDPHFATYASTRLDNLNGTALLAGNGENGNNRYVVGPAALTQAAVKSVSVQHLNGNWVVKLILSTSGSRQLDTLTQTQFHAIIGIDLNGQVISAPITEPTQSGWASFRGQVTIGGGFTEHQAKVLAAKL
jgi:SecD-like export protein